MRGTHSSSSHRRGRVGLDCIGRWSGRIRSRLSQCHVAGSDGSGRWITVAPFRPNFLRLAISFLVGG